MKRAIVVGGGISGLALGHFLRAAGREALVLEASDRAGGLIRTEREDGYLCEFGASAFMDGDAVELCGELGVPLVEASKAAKRRWIFRDGRLRRVPLSLRGVLRALVEPVVRRGRGEETVAAFARRRFGREAAEALAAPAVVGVFAGDAERLSVQAAFPRLAELERKHGSVVRGMFKRSGPRLRLRSPREGVEALPRALAARLGDALRLGARVSEVREGSVVVDGEELAGEVVLAVPPAEAARLLGGGDAELGGALDRVPTAGVAVACAGFRREHVQHPLDGFGFLVAPGEQMRCLGLVFESTVWPDRAPEGHVLLRAIYGGVRDPAALDLDDDGLRAQLLVDLAHAFGVVRPPAFFKARRMPRAIPQYEVGHAARVADAERRAAAQGVRLLGNAYHGVAVNDCVRSARRLAAALIPVLAACGGPGPRVADTQHPPAVADAAIVTPAGAAAPYRVAADGSRLVVEGVVKLAAPAPAEQPAKTACGAPAAPRVALGVDGGVDGALVWLETDRGVAPDLKAPPAEIVLVGCRFAPRAVVVPRLGAELAITNGDELRHEPVVTQTGAELARLPMPLEGGRYAVTITNPGPFEITCALHPDERAWGIAPPHPYHDATGADGTFHLAHVPPGTYRLVAWHPPAAEGSEPLRAETKIIVGAADAPAPLTLELR